MPTPKSSRPGCSDPSLPLCGVGLGPLPSLARQGDRLISVFLASQKRGCGLGSAGAGHGLWSCGRQLTRAWSAVGSLKLLQAGLEWAGIQCFWAERSAAAPTSVSPPSPPGSSLLNARMCRAQTGPQIYRIGPLKVHTWSAVCAHPASPPPSTGDPGEALGLHYSRGRWWGRTSVWGSV